MNTRIAFLFPGQGSQSVGMGRELAALYPVARETFDEADAALGYKLSQVCFDRAPPCKQLARLSPQQTRPTPP